MAIQWGAWRYSGGNGMRVGVELDWRAGNYSQNIEHSTAGVRCLVTVYTENQYSYGDDQRLNYGGAIGGGVNFYNGQAGAIIERDSLEFDYTYGPNEYGSSPGKRTVSVSLSGAFNGITPSVSVTTNIPARPIAAPAAPTNPNVSRINDSSHKLTWTNRSTAGEPWDEVQIDREDNNLDNWARLANVHGGAYQYTDSETYPDMEFQWRVRAKNSAGTSPWTTFDTRWTTPGAPTNCSRATSGADQVVSWVNRVAYNDYETEVWREDVDAGSWERIATVPDGVSSYRDVAPDPAKAWRYRVRAKTSPLVADLGSPTLWSDYSGETSATLGATSPPSAPTDLSPNGTMVVPSLQLTMTWDHNPTDGTLQTKYRYRWREQGSTSWVYQGSATSSSSESHTFPAGSFPNDSQIEVQFMTWGADPTGSNWSASAILITTANPNALREAKRVLMIDLDTTQTETGPQGALVPTGGMIDFGGILAPAGWLLCDGSVQSRTTYADLFAVIGTKYNTGGESSSQFRLPDYRDRTSVGASSSKPLGSSGGAASVILSESNLPPHRHNMDHNHDDVTGDGKHDHQFRYGSGAGGNFNQYAPGNGLQGTSSWIIAVGTGDHTHNVPTRYQDTGSTGGGNGFSVQNPYVASTKIIKV